MIPELGHLALILALLLALIQGTVPLWGASRGDASLMALARPTAAGQMFFAALAFGCLAYAFLTNDFSVENVAHNSFSQLPLVYRFTATWGSHEGSLLLWVLILAFWGGAVALLSRRLPLEIAARVLGVMGLVGAGLLSFLLFTSNPLVRLFPVPEDGADLNPLLQDPGMVLHPPVLYMGYVGFSVAFSFALAALLSGRIDAAWARWARPWTTVAWMFLTLGIALGSWWAYYELGWGGWWFWDPTENASLMPWLAGTALIHSLAVTEKRGGFKGWTLLLAIATFSLSLLGTFLVRSGVLSSVHAFATDPGRGLYILALLGAVIGGSLFLYGWRAPRLGRGGNFAWVSRESLLLGNNVLLVAALGSVLLGTLYPLALDAFGLGKVSVGPPYFNPPEGRSARGPNHRLSAAFSFSRGFSPPISNPPAFSWWLLSAIGRWTCGVGRPPQVRPIPAPRPPRLGLRHRLRWLPRLPIPLPGPLPVPGCARRPPAARPRQPG